MILRDPPVEAERPDPVAGYSQIALGAAWWCPARCPGAAAGASLGGLEQFHHVAGGVLQQDLGATGSGDDVVAEPAAGGAKPLDLAGQVVHLQVQAVPAAGDGPGAVGHGPPARAGRAAEQQPNAVTADG